MPTIGGVTIGWDEASPSDGESAGLGDDRIRSLKTSLRQALAAEHTWDSAGGANTGAHALGSARPYYGVQSAVSSSGSDGRLMQTSDTSSLFHVGSGGTSYIGGATAISHGSFPGGTPPQRYKWAEESGLVALPVGNFTSSVVTFPNSGYSGVPYVYVSQNETSASTTTLSLAQPAAVAMTATGFLLWVATGGTNVAWRSLGTRVL